MDSIPSRWEETFWMSHDLQGACLQCKTEIEISVNHSDSERVAGFHYRMFALSLFGSR
ncbi:MAG: hypothetical protein HN758_10635 [Verrucomicrobia bacterium]|nr:hypothetical protein [Verrucomicrobiota bacterium]MBT7874872.1 hypothetical protein [Verrucomicrobiota bacterium]MDA7631386.1 hypothetical protein [Verrucomicrobiota bacterium]